MAHQRTPHPAWRALGELAEEASAIVTRGDVVVVLAIVDITVAVTIVRDDFELGRCCSGSVRAGCRGAWSFPNVLVDTELL